MNEVRASIIIPTYNRCRSLERTLKTLVDQSIPPAEFEVIVVDDGSIDETRDICRRPFPYYLHYHRQTNQGSAAARNAGAHLASGQLLIFLDDDMLAGTDYISGLIEEHSCYSSIIGMGHELPYLPENASIYAKIMMSSPNPVSEGGAFVDFTACVTNNLSVHRKDFFELGGMEDVAGDGPTWWGDVDFGYRAAKQGFRFRCSNRAVCWHCDYSLTDLQAGTRRAEKVAYMVHYLNRKHPGIEQYLPMFRDMAPIAWGQDSPTLITRKAIRGVSSAAIALACLEASVRFFERVRPAPQALRSLYRWTTGAYIYRGYRQGLRELSRQS